MALHLALTGMSNAGKSYWADRLEREAGFRVHGIDRAIARRLGLERDPLEAEPALARWMGQPSSAGYPQREQEYLRLETDAMAEAFEALREPGDHVIDTTGSVIHLPGGTRRRLRECCHVLWLSLSTVTLDEMIERFRECPKPLVWSGHYQPRPGEDGTSALERCYPRLLDARLRLYSQLAHQQLDAGRLRQDPPTTGQFIRMIEEERHAL